MEMLKKLVLNKVTLGVTPLAAIITAFGLNPEWITKICHILLLICGCEHG